MLEQANDDEAQIFISALQEALGPLVRPRYLEDEAARSRLEELRRSDRLTQLISSH